MKRILYVDFENVSSAGLNGIQKLTDNDEVKIFLGPKCSKMSLIEAESVLHCDATVVLIKNDQIGKNALDFIIMVHLGYDIAKRQGDAFFIISNDKGYEPAIHEMQSKTGEMIERFADIEQAAARKVEKTGWFARLFKKKKPVVENTTEHEVLNKKGRTGGHGSNSSRNGSGSGARNGSKNQSASRPNDNRNGAGSTRPAGGRNDNRPRNGAPNNARTNNAQNSVKKPDNTAAKTPNVKVVTAKSGAENAAAKKPAVTAKSGAETKVVTAKSGIDSKTTPDSKPVTVKVAAEAKPVQKPAVPAPKAPETKAPETKANAPKPVSSSLITSDDSYLDDLSIADLRAKLNVKKEAPAAQSAKAAPKPAAKLEMTDAERDLVNRALDETDNLGDFHNYILKELRDNDRATEIYKAEKHKVGKKNNG
ncbi:MAG: hypothetical protein J5643_08665 [Lachnospiraceae bacterium]|nr:hypothetical protein [Lachnospiraceae bacterium]